MVLVQDSDEVYGMMGGDERMMVDEQAEGLP